MQLNPEMTKKLRDQCMNNLFFLARVVLGFKDLAPKIHLSICNELMDYEKNTRITVELPRTWFKSTLVSVSYIIWRIINNPNVRILIVQNTYANACKKLGSIKAIFEKNHLFRALFYDVLPDQTCRWSGECLEVKRSQAHPEGTVEAAGVGTATTSRHYDVIDEDDTIAPKKDDMTGIVQQPTRLDIEKAIGFHNLCHPMLLHPTKSQIVVVGTRWAERDLLGYIYEDFPEYTKIRKTACEKDGEPATLLEGGKPTWPERFDEEVLNELLKVEGPYMFASLYLGKPTAAINQVFKREWIKYRDRQPKGSYICTSVDLAAAEHEESGDPDYNVILTAAVSPESGIVTVLEYTRERMSPSSVIDTIFQHYARYKSTKVLVEAIGYQRTLLHFMKRRMKRTDLGVMMSVEEIRSHKQSKVDRIRGLQPYFAAGLISIRPGMSELEQELLAFPKGAHDDLIDALSMQIPFWVEMTQMSEMAIEEEFYDQMSGKAIISELRGRINGINQYPYDMGNMDDRYVNEFGSAILRGEIVRRAEAYRRAVLVA